MVTRDKTEWKFYTFVSTAARLKDDSIFEAIKVFSKKDQIVPAQGNYLCIKLSAARKRRAANSWGVTTSV